MLLEKTALSLGDASGDDLARSCYYHSSLLKLFLTPKIANFK
jgi:hypothetical protein